ncbi:MAG: endonuclease/exonuclease/phosphatase family protein [Planctomycetota bacterium]
MKPEYGETGIPPKTGSMEEIKVLSYNIAKCFYYQEGYSPEKVKKRLDGIASFIQEEQPDLVCLSEIVYDCAPCPVNQVVYLAAQSKMHAYAFGPNYCWGLPFWKIRTGNAVLSRWPLRPLENVPLPGRKSFFYPKGNRCILFCEIRIHDKTIRVGSLHNDSYDPGNNFRQTEYILNMIDGQPTFLAGDFNATPSQPSMIAYKTSGLFAGTWNGPPTWPAENPRNCIDFILAPRNWTLREHRVPHVNHSDHLPVISVFQILQ